jgi:uncharacterized protein
MTVVHLRHVKLRPGDEYRDALEVELSPVELGGERYLPVPERVVTEIAINRTTGGTVFTLDFAARVHGPCVRCLGDAVLEVPIRAREYQANDPEGDDELMTDYVVDAVLDVSAWAHDALVLALPEQILCRPDCAGLCPVCGRNLNDEPHVHEEVAPDPRWAALSELEDRLD